MHDAPRSPTAGLGRFSVSALVFLLPLAVGAVVLLRTPLSRSFAWHFVRGDCQDRDGQGRGIWLHDRIQATDRPVDVAFVGTSRTILSIDDAAIEADLRQRGIKAHVANFGYCRNGRNMHVAIARDLLAAQEVKHLVVEVSNREFDDSHPMYGYVARTDDLWARPIERGFTYLKDLYHGLLVRLDQAKTRLLGFTMPPAKAPNPPRGHFANPGFARANVLTRDQWLESLARTKARRSARAERRGAPSAWRSRLSHAELRYLAGLAAATGTRLHFLYMQSYGEPWARIWSRSVYEPLGDVWIPPASIFQDPENWWDEHHLSARGARDLSAWLAERIAEAR